MCAKTTALNKRSELPLFILIPIGLPHAALRATTSIVARGGGNGTGRNLQPLARLPPTLSPCWLSRGGQGGASRHRRILTSRHRLANNMPPLLCHLWITCFAAIPRIFWHGNVICFAAAGPMLVAAFGADELNAFAEHHSGWRCGAIPHH